MKIHIKDLRRIIRETIREASSYDVSMSSDPGTIAAAYDDLMSFASKEWRIEYASDEGPFKGTGVMGKVKSEAPAFESSAWSSLNPFEQYCLVSGTKGKYSVCDQILDAAGASSGVWFASGLSRKSKTSMDYGDFIKHILGGDAAAVSDFRKQESSMIVGAAKDRKRSRR